MSRHGSTTHWWSPGCDLSHVMLPNQSWKGFYRTINQLLSPRLTSSNMGWVLDRSLPSMAWREGRCLGWLGWPLVAHLPAPRNTNTHNCSKPAGLVSGRPSLQVTVQSPVWLVQVFFWPGASMRNVPFYGLGQLHGTAGQQCPIPVVPAWQEQGTQAVMLGRVAQTLDCFETKFPNPAKLFSKALLWSTGILPWWGICSLYIYMCMSLCVCLYTFMHKYVCAYVCVCPVWGDALRKSSI